jgi:CheY-like chemotaxis protein
VLLPVAPAEDVPSQTAPSPPRPAVRPRVLAIDDDDAILTTLTRVLRQDCDLVTVASAREAFGRIQAEAFDVILCDLMMPQMTGMELHAVLKTAAPAEADKMIFLTGGTFTPQAQTFLDTVPNLRLEKPFDVKHLRAIVRERARRVSNPP